MTNLTKINDHSHRNLKLSTDCTMELASQSHVINLNAAEVGKAASSFPVFLSRNAHNGNWALSAMTSFQQGDNLFVDNGVWLATYQPTGLQTYPFCLIQSEDEPDKLSLGFDADSPSFSEEQGEPLFAEDGKPSDLLQQVTSILEADVQHAAHTRQFTQKLETMGLIKAIDVNVSYEDGSVQTIKGLNTINEDKLRLLGAEDLVTLNQSGYLLVIHAMLASLYQVNTLIRLQAAKPLPNKVVQIKLEVAKDSAVA